MDSTSTSAKKQFTKSNYDSLSWGDRHLLYFKFHEARIIAQGRWIRDRIRAMRDFREALPD